MNGRRILATGLALALTSTALLAQFKSDAYYVSVPFTTAPGIYEVDADTGVATPFAVPALIPHYGWFGNDGNFYVPDRGVPGLLKILPDGSIVIHASGGHFIRPVTCIPTMDDDAWLVADMESDKIVHVDYAGNQTLMYDSASTGGLLDGPDGLAYDEDGNLFVSYLGNDTFVKIDPQRNATLFSDSDLFKAPGGIAIDGGGNLFVANYDLHTIARFRLDTGEGMVFAGPDSSKMAAPNDLKLSRGGGLIVAGRVGRVSHIDALGNITVLSENPDLSELDGVSVPNDDTLCSGRYESYGTGVAGTGGYVPSLRTVFSPCAGHNIALEFHDTVGGTQAMLLVSGAPLAPGQGNFLGAPLLIDPSAPPFLAIPLWMPGAGAGNGDLDLQFVVPEDPGLPGLELYHQFFAADPGAPFGISASNGLKETFGL